MSLPEKVFGALAFSLAIAVLVYVVVTVLMGPYQTTGLTP